MNRFEHREVYDDVWLDGSQPYHCNEKDILLKLELDEEAFRRFKVERGLSPQLQLEDLQMEEPEVACEGEGRLPGEKKRKSWGPDQILLSYTPNPTNGPSETMPRYFMRHVSTMFPEGVPAIDENFTRYHEGKNLRLTPEQSRLKTIWLKPNMLTP